MRRLTAGVLMACAGLGAQAATLDGQVLAARAPVPNATVTLWSASAGPPRALARVRSGPDGRFALEAPSHANTSLYLVAQGGSNHPALTLLAVLGPTPPRKVVIN